jgi:transposase-like protein
MLDTTLTFGGAFFMAGITLAQKIDAIFRFENGDESLTSIAKSLNLTTTEMLNFWIEKYHFHGPESLKKSYTRYTFEDKLYILNYMNENGLSSLEAAVHLNLPTPGTIRRWRISLGNESVDSLILKKKGHTKLKRDNPKKAKNQIFEEGSLEALQAENERLRMENAFLKKLNALVQEKETLQRKTRRK